MEGQLSFLRYAVEAPPEVFTFGHSLRQLVSDPRIHNLYFASHASFLSIYK